MTEEFINEYVDRLAKEIAEVKKSELLHAVRADQFVKEHEKIIGEITKQFNEQNEALSKELNEIRAKFEDVNQQLGAKNDVVGNVNRMKEEFETKYHLEVHDHNKTRDARDKQVAELTKKIEELENSNSSLVQKIMALEAPKAKGKKKETADTF